MIRFLFVILSVLVVLFLLEPTERYKMVNDGLHKAWYVRLPGYVESYSPEHVIQLKDWAGSNLKGMEVTVDGTRNPEIEAEPVVRMLGIATGDYVRELGPDGHYVLRKPAQTFRTFSFRAYHRVTALKPVKE